MQRLLELDELRTAIRAALFNPVDVYQAHYLAQRIAGYLGVPSPALQDPQSLMAWMAIASVALALGDPPTPSYPVNKQDGREVIIDWPPPDPLPPSPRAPKE